MASSVCKPLQCLTSTLTQGGEGGHLSRLTCSVVLRGGRLTASKHHWRVWGALAVSGPPWVCPRSHRVRFQGLHCSGSRLLCRELSEAGPGLRALPRSKPLRFRFSGTPQGHGLSWACILCPSQVRAAKVTRCLVSTLSPGLGGGDWVLRLPRPNRSVSWVHSKSAVSAVPRVSSGELTSGCDPPGGCQPSRIPGRLG